MAAGMRWDGTKEFEQGFERYMKRVHFAIQQVATYWAVVFESYAKEKAPWTDRTSNARQSLHAWTEDLSQDVVRLWLSHGMDYGLYLETKYAGQYAIIWPTIEQHLEAIRQMLQEIFK